MRSGDASQQEMFRVSNGMDAIEFHGKHSFPRPRLFSANHDLAFIVATTENKENHD